MEKSINEFKKNGYCIFENEDLSSHKILSDSLCDSLGSNFEDLSDLHHLISKSKLNESRLKSFSVINSLPEKNKIIFNQAKKFLFSLLGPDISIQNKLNLSIQIPLDDTSLLPLHTDTISGESAFEVVVWVPLTKAFESNSMYLLPINKSIEMMSKIQDYSDLGMQQMESDFQSYKKFIEINPNQVLVFSPTLFHGNVVNETSKTRVSINCRFKNIFSPESSNPERRLGTFYEVFNKSPLTDIALSYKDPYISSL